MVEAGPFQLHSESASYFGLGVNRGTFAVCRSLPVCTQLRTWRCTAITDAMCMETATPERFLYEFKEMLLMPDIWWLSSGCFGS